MSSICVHQEQERRGRAVLPNGSWMQCAKMCFGDISPHPIGRGKRVSCRTCRHQKVNQSLIAKNIPSPWTAASERRQVLECGDGVCAIAALARDSLGRVSERPSALGSADPKAVTAQTPSPHSKMLAPSRILQSGSSVQCAKFCFGEVSPHWPRWMERGAALTACLRLSLEHLDKGFLWNLD